jgi:multiple sugar transport system ATP-binding protein
MAAVELRGIGKSFGKTEVLRGVSLDIADREFMTLVGPSGCGKSTLLRIIAGLESQDTGEVRIDGASVDGRRAADRDLAMVFQSYALYPHLTARRNIAVPLAMRRLSTAQRLPLIGRILPGARSIRSAIDAEVERVAQVLRIEALLERKPGQLSGGQRQRVALGRAMVRAPKAFLMDEPLSNLDAKLREHMRTEIAQLQHALGATFIYVTHDQAEAMTMSDRIAVMMDGEILQLGSPAEIYADPVDLRVAEFIGSPRINVVAGRVAARGKVAAAGAMLSLDTAAPEGTPLNIAFRPEATALVPPDARHPIGRVTLLEHLGSDLLVHLALEQAEDTPIILRAPPRGSALRLDERVGIDVPAEQVLLFDARGRRIAAAPAIEPRLRAHG